MAALTEVTVYPALPFNIEDYLPALRRAGLHFVGANEAEDLVQDTVLRALSTATYDPTKSSPQTWLYAIMRNLRNKLAGEPKLLRFADALAEMRDDAFDPDDIDADGTMSHTITSTAALKFARPADWQIPSQEHHILLGEVLSAVKFLPQRQCEAMQRHLTGCRGQIAHHTHLYLARKALRQRFEQLPRSRLIRDLRGIGRAQGPFSLIAFMPSE